MLSDPSLIEWHAIFTVLRRDADQVLQKFIQIYKYVKNL